MCAYTHHVFAHRDTEVHACQCIHIGVYTSTCPLSHAHTCILEYTYMLSHEYSHRQAPLHSHPPTCILSRLPQIHAHAYTRACSHTFTHLHTQTGACLFIYMHSYTQVHTYMITHMHAHTHAHTYTCTLTQRCSHNHSISIFQPGQFSVDIVAPSPASWGPSWM